MATPKVTVKGIVVLFLGLVTPVFAQLKSQQKGSRLNLQYPLQSSDFLLQIAIDEQTLFETFDGGADRDTRRHRPLGPTQPSA